MRGCGTLGGPGAWVRASAVCEAPRQRASPRADACAIRVAVVVLALVLSGVRSVYVLCCGFFVPCPFSFLSCFVCACVSVRLLSSLKFFLSFCLFVPSFVFSACCCCCIHLLECQGVTAENVVNHMRVLYGHLSTEIHGNSIKTGTGK